MRFAEFMYIGSGGKTGEAEVDFHFKEEGI